MGQNTLILGAQQHGPTCEGPVTPPPAGFTSLTPPVWVLSLGEISIATRPPTLPGQAEAIGTGTCSRGGGIYNTVNQGANSAHHAGKRDMQTASIQKCTPAGSAVTTRAFRTVRTCACMLAAGLRMHVDAGYCVLAEMCPMHIAKVEESARGQPTFPASLLRSPFKDMMRPYSTGSTWERRGGICTQYSMVIIWYTDNDSHKQHYLMRM